VTSRCGHVPSRSSLAKTSPRTERSAAAVPRCTGECKDHQRLAQPVA
jgi:hypothetical protein